MQREVDTNPSLRKTLTAPVGDYLRRLYYDSIAFEPSMLRYAAEVVTPERLFLGSDAPFPLGEPDPVNFVRRALPAEQAAGILSANFERLLQI
jgi:aminocarboxymuconate-semialdehyde decarboxylase